MNKKPIIAFLYDFDKTLCTTDMQDYTFIPSLGYTPGEFWSIANSFGFENRMDGLLAYMYTMIEECHKKGQPVLVGTISIEKSEELSAMRSSCSQACRTGSRASTPSAKRWAWRSSTMCSPPACARSSRAAA